MKPHIKFDTEQQAWVCHDNYYIWGRGETPLLAYCDWKIRESKRTLLPRRGLWNRKDCLSWFYAGCHLIRYYIGNQQVFGYNPSTDDLILRG